MNKDNLRPVTSIKHDDKRAAIPDSAHQGEEQMAISGMPEQSEYDILILHIPILFDDYLTDSLLF